MIDNTNNTNDTDISIEDFILPPMKHTDATKTNIRLSSNINKDIEFMDRSRIKNANNDQLNQLHGGMEKLNIVKCVNNNCKTLSKSIQVIEDEKRTSSDDFLTSNTPLNCYIDNQFRDPKNPSPKSNKSIDDIKYLELNSPPFSKSYPNNDNQKSKNEIIPGPNVNCSDEIILTVDLQKLSGESPDLILTALSPVEIFESNLKIFLSVKIINIQNINNKRSFKDTNEAIDGKQAQQMAINQMAHNLSECKIMNSANPIVKINMGDSINVDKINDQKMYVFLVARVSHKIHSRVHYMATNITQKITECIMSSGDSNKMEINQCHQSPSDGDRYYAVNEINAFHISLVIPEEPKKTVYKQFKAPSKSQLKHNQSVNSSKTNNKIKTKIYKAKFILRKDENLLSFGLKICGSGPTFISSIIRDSHAWQMSIFKTGDTILSINHKSVKFSSYLVVDSIIKASQPNLRIILQRTSMPNITLKIWHMSPTKCLKMPHLQRDSSLQDSLSDNMNIDQIRDQSKPNTCESTVSLKSLKSFECNLNRLEDLENIFKSSNNFLHQSSSELSELINATDLKVPSGKTNDTHNNAISDKSDSNLNDLSTTIYNDMYREIYNISSILTQSVYNFVPFVDELEKSMPDNLFNRLSSKFGRLIKYLESLNDSITHIITSLVYEKSTCIVCKLNLIFFEEYLEYIRITMRYNQSLLSFFKLAIRYYKREKEQENLASQISFDENFIHTILIPSETISEICKSLVRICYCSNHPKLKDDCPLSKNHIIFDKTIEIINEKHRNLNMMKIDHVCLSKFISDLINDYNWFDHNNSSILIGRRLIWGIYFAQKNLFESETIECTNFANFIDLNYSSYSDLQNIQLNNDVNKIKVFLIATASILLVTLRVKKTMRLSVSYTFDLNSIYDVSYNTTTENRHLLFINCSHWPHICLEFNKLATLEKYYKLLKKWSTNHQ